MKQWFGILLALMLPALGAAAQENEVMVLPSVAPVLRVEAVAGADYSTAPMKEYYDAAGYGLVGEDYQAPRMTAEERERASALLLAYQAGKRPKHNVLNKLENATVGVYTLNPEDYEGETVFTLIPVDPLTDEQILEVIDAFAQCGLMFDPEALSYKNCMRGGGIEASRFFQEEENNRRSWLKDMYVRTGLTSEHAFTPLVSDDGFGWVTLNAEAYCGLDSFLFNPYRPLTDDELLRYVIYTGTGDPTEYGNYAEYEKQLRLELTRLLGAPLSMTRVDEVTCVMGDCHVGYDDEKVYYASFRTTEDTQYAGYLDIDTRKVIMADSWNHGNLVYSDLHLNPFDDKWLTIAKDAVLQAREDSMAIAGAESRGEVTIQDGGYGVKIHVIMADGSYYEVTVAYQSEAVYGGLRYEFRAPDLERMYPAGMFE